LKERQKKEAENLPNEEGGMEEKELFWNEKNEERR
jgi:hypothetical protein